jgi:predicted transcriptional regulator
MENLVCENQFTSKGNRVTGIFQKADVRNHNGRVYKRSLWESILARSDIKDTLAGRTMLGELGHPECVDTTPVNVSHIVTELKLLPNGDIYGEAEILDTPSGRILKTFYEAGVKMGISSRGYLPEGSNLFPEGSDLVVPDDFELITFDFVIVPSTPGANPTVQEGHRKQLSTILSEGRKKINTDIATFIENLATAPASKATPLLEKAQRTAPAAAQPGTKITKKEGSPSMKAQTGYNKNLLGIIASLKDRYLVAEGILQDLLDERITVADLTDDISARYLTAEGIIKEFARYTKQLEEALQLTAKKAKISEGVVSELKTRYTLAEGVIEQLRDRYTLSEQVIEVLRNRQQISEQVIAELRDRVNSAPNKSSARSVKESSLDSVTEGVITDLRDRVNVSEGIITEMAAQLKEATAPKERKKVPPQYFDRISAEYGISVQEARRIFKEVGGSVKAFKFHLNEKKRLTSKNYREFPYMGGKSVTEQTLYATSKDGCEETDKLARIVAGQFNG